MALPAIPVIAAGAMKAYSAYKTAKGAVDTAATVVKACKGATNVLSQTKVAIDTFDGGVFSSSADGTKGPAIDMQKLEGVITEPGKVPLGMNNEESSFYQNFLLNLIGMAGANGAEQSGPDHDAPSGPGR